jgi:pyruvate,water dikinase
MRDDIHYREHVLREGDLVVLDANNGFLRVLGQSRDASILHENLQHFGMVCHRLFRTTDERKFLEIRGERLKILYHIEKHLSKLKRPVLACHVIHELLLGEHLSGVAKNVNENARLLSRILENPMVGDICREYLLTTARELANRHRALARAIRDLATSSTDLVEVLTLRLREIRLRQSLNEILEAMKASNFDFHEVQDAIDAHESVNEIIRMRLEVLRTRLMQEIESSDEFNKMGASRRHLLRRLMRLNAVLGSSQTHDRLTDRIRIEIEKEDRSARIQYKDRRILWSREAGFEHFHAIGWKAANLAEIERIGGGGLTPPWFVITDVAFREVMDQVLGSRYKKSEPLRPDMTLREGIQTILRRDDLDNFEKSEQIRRLWQNITLPSELVRTVNAAYRRLIEGAGKQEASRGVYVALRSSAREEDTEDAIRAGEFDTFLYIRGEDFLVDHLRLAWSGLWTERAIHNREIMESDFEEIGGGLIVQQNMFPKVSGVLQTVNVAEYEMREMVVNAGLGVGAGIVSGTVAADHFVVTKENDFDDVRLRMRPMINDKREQVIFNAREGIGTVRTEVSYHQRLRPALEYVELCELVRIASRLEKVYGYPLDIEFCVEGARVWLLQARPVPTFESVLRRTLKDYPIAEKKMEQQI